MSVQQSLCRPRSRSGLGASVFVSALMTLSPIASAHHSFAPLLMTNGEETILTADGTVRVFKVLNPHGALIVDVTDESGATEGWLLELSPAAQLAREGWTDDTVRAGDKVTVAILVSRSPNRGRLRAVLVHGRTQGEAAQLLVSYGIRGDTDVMLRLRDRLPTCGTIDQSYNRTECFLVDDQAMSALKEEFPGVMGYVLP